MRVLFLFLDGVGLGPADPDTNPFARAPMPHLRNLLGGHRLLLESLYSSSSKSQNKRPWQYVAPTDPSLISNLQSPPFPRATLLPLNATLGTPGLPQSATGQATLLTGVNVPATLGYHYGPKPNPAVAEQLRNENLFSSLVKKGRRAALLNAYPPTYFAAIHSGRRMYSAIPLAVVSAGLPLKTDIDLFNGQALSADFTGEGWRDRLGFTTTPLLTPHQAGERLAELSRQHDFALFEFWLTDYVGHKQDMASALILLETFDQMLGGLLEAWDDQEGLILLTSDHGNLENLATRRHTTNSVPALLIGAPHLRQSFSARLTDLTRVAPAILRLLA